MFHRSWSYLISFLLIVISLGELRAVVNPRVFLVGKLEYKDLESSNKLVDRAIANTFGASNDQNSYYFNIKKVDASCEAIPEFRYAPDVDAQGKTKLNKFVMAASSNTSIKFKIALNMVKSILNPRVREQMNEDGEFEIEVVVVGDERIFVTEAVGKDVYNEMLDANSFVDKAFKNFFGPNVMNMNYHVEVLTTSACLIKDVNKGECVRTYSVNQKDSMYNDFASNVSSKEYSSAFILFDVLVSKEKSRLIQKANDVIIRDADRTEHIRFYFCIPKENLRPGSGRFFDIEAKIVSNLRKPLAGISVDLKDINNKVVATQKTDDKGYVRFNKVDEGMSYTLFIDKSYKDEGMKVTTKTDKPIGTFQKTKAGFDYKLLTADLNKMEFVEAADPGGEFNLKIKARIVSVTDKINPVANQVVELRDAQNKLLQSKITNNDGDFEFSDVNIKEIYSVELFEYKEKFKSEKLYISNTKNELIARILRDANGKFAYRTIPADLMNMSDMEDEDISLSIKKQLKLNEKNIVIRDFVFYDVNSSVLSDEAKVTLDKIIKIAKENKESGIEIISHTDTRGEGADNLKLSQKRSDSVLEYFVKNGIDKQRLTSIGKGESEPLNSCTDGVSCTEEEYKMNRRTEFKFSKK